MNKEIEKAINRQGKEHKILNWWNQICKWWGKNNYKVFRVVLFPVWIYEILQPKIEKKINELTPWSETRANEILSYYIPRRAEWDKEKQSFYICDSWMGWNFKLAKKYLKIKDYRFWKLYSNGLPNCIEKYLKDHFELEGFTKIVYSQDNEWTEIEFIKN